MLYRLCYSIAFLILCLPAVKAQGIRGSITTANQEPLPFSTIYVEGLETGTTSNADAYYELRIPSGKYTVYYKFIGYETQVKEVEISQENFLQLNIVMQPQVLLLNEVVTTAQATDPANWMMKRAIAKSSYNRQLIDAYQAKVYVKGKGRVTDIPFYMKGLLSKEGIDTSTQLITESLSEVSFKRPNQFSEKVISVYASKKTDFNANPMPYIASSFYQDEVAGSISPFSSKAFSYYRFKHIGAFTDGGKLINRIAVRPKVKGTNVFIGEIQLIEDEWTIYNLDLSTQIEYGIEFNIKQVYQFIAEAAWMPITHQITGSGELMGVSFVFEYLASVSDYRLQLNPALPRKLEILDSPNKKEDKVSSQVKATGERIRSAAALRQTNSEKVNVTVEELPEIMKAYKKQQDDSLRKLDIVGIYDFKVDSAAYSQDSIFWGQVRTIPLSKNESRGYQKIDSLTIIQAAEELKDSIKNARRATFQPTDIITGGRYAIDSSGHYQFVIYNALLGTQFNTVEGVNISYSLGLKRNLPLNFNRALSAQHDYSYYKSPYLLIKPTVRYAFAREKFVGKLLLKYRFPTGSIGISGGRYVSQFNNAPPLQPIMNTSFTLIWEQNLMKIYEREFVDIHYEKTISSKFNYSAYLGYEERHRLYNNSLYSFIDWKRAFTPNLPVNAEGFDVFEGQKALSANIKLFYKPFVKYQIRNGRKLPVNENSSEFSLAFYSGIPSILASEVNYNRIEVGYKDQYDFGAKGDLFINAKLGGFLTNNELGFMDYAHFQGNRSFITQADPVSSYRLLDYYFNSTDQQYAQLFLFQNFRKLLITQIAATRLFGLKEGLFANYLGTENSNNYTELGYSIGGILNFFRIEVATQYENFQYKGWGVRVGVSTSLGGRISITSEDE